uniref:Transposase IS4-like domain-containing protein n=1 Tax=Clastoptera arizonana TaxID=38151 RepID=A0A1B6DD45_9HEMI
MSNTANKLYRIEDDQLIFICDGTYIRHHKSPNNEYQRKSYSGQKKVPLCKPFTICTTNGFVIDMLGPYTANMNDAEIMKVILNDPHGLIKLLKKDDIILVDRGFRDVIVHLEELGFKVLMPALKGKRNQLTTSESNESRFVTKTRWVVEAVYMALLNKS